MERMKGKSVCEECESRTLPSVEGKGACNVRCSSEPYGILKEHQAREPWCSRLLLIQRFEGHISPCYCTTSPSTVTQVQ